MLLKATGREITQNKLIYDGCFEHSFENEVILPDYFPDIMRVVRVDAEQKLRDTNISGDRVTAEGVTVFRILYMPSQSEEEEQAPTLKCFTYSVPFEKSGDIKMGDGAHANVTLKTQYLSCRILNPRKAAVKATVGICVNVTAPEKVMICDALDGVRIDIQLLTKEISVSSPIASIEKSFKLYEDLEIDSNRPKVAEIISASGHAMLTEMKIIANKAVIKGDAYIKLLYMPQDGIVPEPVSYIIPFSQIIDIDGIDDGDACIMDFTVADIITSLMEGQTEGGRLISAEILLRASANAYRNERAEYVADAFSTVFDTAVMTKLCKTETLAHTLDERATVSEKVALNVPQMLAILDTAAEPYIKSGARNEKGGITVNGNIEMSALVLTSDNGIENCDRSVPFSITLPYNCDRADIKANITEINSSVQGDDADMRFSLVLTGAMFTQDQTDMVTGVEINEAKVKEQAKTSLTVYYPEKNEAVWDIAKRYGVAVEAISTANSIAEETVGERKIILISRKK